MQLILVPETSKLVDTVQLSMTSADTAIEACAASNNEIGAADVGPAKPITADPSNAPTGALKRITSPLQSNIAWKSSSNRLREHRGVTSVVRKGAAN